MFQASTLIFLALVSLPARADELPSGYTALAETKVANVDLEGDGKTRIQRRYDKNGNLAEVTFFDYSVDPPQIERLTVSREERVRTTELGKILIRRETEKYAAPGVLSQRDVEWSSQRDGKIDRRTLMRYMDLKVDITEFEYISGAWKQTSSSRASAIESKSALDHYVACFRTNQPQFDELACRTLLDQIPISELKLEELELSKYVNLECTNESTLFLPNGFSVDLTSCTDKKQSDKPIDAIRAATNTMMSTQLACVRKFNSRLSRRLAFEISASRPLIRCARDESRLPAAALCSVQVDEGCSATLAEHRKSDDGFYLGSRPTEIYLAGADPIDGHSPTLAATLFHEVLHTLGHRHEVTAGAGFEDMVYGCEALCGGIASKSFQTRAGCEACAKAEGNLPSKKVLAQCKDFK